MDATRRSVLARGRVLLLFCGTALTKETAMWAAWIVVVSLAAAWPTVCSGEGGKPTPSAPALFL
jgi:hypothetical protein